MQRGFTRAVNDADLRSCDLLWLTDAEDTFLIRGSSRYPPMRGTLLALDDEHFALYTHGSVPYYKTYPSMYVPRPLGIRPAQTERDIRRFESCRGRSTSPHGVLLRRRRFVRDGGRAG